MAYKHGKTTVALIILVALLIGGCSFFRLGDIGELPPLLTQDELARPYVKLGRILVTRETYGSDGTLTPDIREWGFNAVRMEAARMGADGVMLLEVDGRTVSYGLLPSTEYRASGVAIKFK